MQAHIDSDPETLPCVKVALPITASVSFRPVCAEGDGSEEWRSIATETGPLQDALRHVATVAAPQAAPVVDDSPTDVMTRRWWDARIDVWEPPVPIVPQLPLELLMCARAERVAVRPAPPRGTDWRSSLAPLSLLLAALSLVPPVGTAPVPPARARTHAIVLHDSEPTPPAPAPAITGSPAPVVAPARVVAPPATFVVQRRTPPPRAPHHAAARSSAQLVRDVPF